jgi:hypothetical protein
MWYRVFGRSDGEVSLAALLRHLHEAGLNLTGEFKGDDLGWWGGELILAGGGTPVYLERYLADADNLRADLNSWAAWLETADYDLNNEMLMERVIQTRQLFTLRRPVDHADEVALELLCSETCRFLAELTDGVYQLDDVGWFAKDGTMLLREY